jgi:hypothetical protein
MAGEADQNPPVITEPAGGGNKSDSGTENYTFEEPKNLKVHDVDKKEQWDKRIRSINLIGTII